jgi:hypothetical protein
VDERNAELQAAIDALQEQITTLVNNGFGSAPATFIEFDAKQIPATSLANRVNVANAYTEFHDPSDICEIVNSNTIKFNTDGNYTVIFSCATGPAGSLGFSIMYIRPLINGVAFANLGVSNYVKGGTAAPSASINFSRFFTANDVLHFDAGMTASAGETRVKKITIIRH